MKSRKPTPDSHPRSRQEQEAWKLCQHGQDAEAFMKLLSKNAQDGDVGSLQRLKMLALRCSTELDRCARAGSQEAVQAVVETAIWSIQGLETLYSTRHLDALKRIARKSTGWPGFLYLHRERKQKAEDRIRILDLGKDTGINYEGKRFSLQTKSTRIALELKEHIELLRRPLNRPNWLMSLLGADADKEKEFKAINKAATALPDLDRNTYKKWWKVAERVFIFGNGSNFEDTDIFKGYWRNAPVDNRTGKPSRARVRDEIKKSIKQGFKSIAAAPR